jgi:CubicO group peptidase (beta-lactamase class C family)
MLLNYGELEGIRILSRKAVELMSSPRLDIDDDDEPDFGFGFYITGDVAKEGALGSAGAYTWGGAFYTSFWIDPREDLVAVFMSQLIPAKTDVSSKFRSSVYQALE